MFPLRNDFILTVFPHFLSRRWALALILTVCLSGCDPVSLTAASLGAATGITHTLGGIIYKTFTAPMKTVENASVRAMKDMGIEVTSRTTNENGERVIVGKARNRDIELLLEPLTKQTTRIRAIARNGLLKDSATATEIVLQTERVLIGS